MRILFLSTWFPYPPDNGSKIRVYHLLSALARSHQVTLVSFSIGNGQGGASEAIPGVKVHLVDVDPYRYVGLPQVVKFASPIPVMFWPSRLMRQAIAQMSSRRPWDAVVVFQPPAAQYALQIADAPRVLDVDTAFSYQMLERHVRQRGPGRLRTWASWQKTQQYESRLFRNFQVCTVVSAREQAHVAALVNGAGCRVDVVSNGVDCGRNRMGLTQPRGNSVVFNGALTYSANYDAMQYFLAEIYPLMQRQSPDIELYITGSTAGVNLAGLRLDASVHLTGYVEDIRRLIAGASACVVPLRQGGGTRLKILEAMALGVPVLSTSKGAEGLEVIDGEHILLADSPQAFADRTAQVLHDPSLRQYLAANARRLVEQRYDWAQIGQRFVTLVESVAGRTGRGGKGS